MPGLTEESSVSLRSTKTFTFLTHEWKTVNGNIVQQKSTDAAIFQERYLLRANPKTGHIRLRCGKWRSD